MIVRGIEEGNDGKTTEWTQPKEGKGVQKRNKGKGDGSASCVWKLLLGRGGEGSCYDKINPSQPSVGSSS
jgi:hypothetical protein